MKKLTLLTFFALLSSMVLAQTEYIFHQNESLALFDLKMVGNSVFISLQYRDGSGNAESFIVRGDKSMSYRDTLFLSSVAPGKRVLSISDPIGDSLFIVLMAKTESGQPYESELLFMDTALNVSSRKALPPTTVLPHDLLVVGDSLLYLYGGDVWRRRDFYVGKYDLSGNLIKDTIFLNGTYILEAALEIDGGDLLLIRGETRMRLDGVTLELDTIAGYGTSFVHKVLPHPDGHFYVTGWVMAQSLPVEIGVYIHKTDSAGNSIDSAAFTKLYGYDMYTYYKEGCVLKSGELLLPYRWDSLYLEDIPCLKIMFVDEKLQLKKTITRFFNRDIWVVNSVATDDGGAIIIGEIEDTMNGGYDTYYLHLDSLGNFSPLTIFDTDAPNQGQLSLYPNPANDVIFIKGLDDQAIIDVFVTDISGAVVEKKELTYPFRMETNHLVSGVYSLLVADKRGNSFTLKMIKN
ncbi:hypothetical protein Oweho_2013 [Owenweeksia hongkongensis DSM 17368]|uniref:Secretion system C-terminal sorting domain-containing protein n=1 Tax=Owenweeksia hongkongensis (strain DSM 17368 / CIP 108786 / JCM 12287 / NRRL B-23963 / UST20020801) TaxID=926562 RepID=G8R2Z6_OWEHD|nr:T9SS type A sorting domain-containing protein [Owenweeksia hongkongensis]AEV32990.1 hypothetical protein Oweho_2013 [Owenweeksia hongkongensis DSM 17368]